MKVFLGVSFSLYLFCLGSVDVSPFAGASHALEKLGRRCPLAFLVLFSFSLLLLRPSFLFWGLLLLSSFSPPPSSSSSFFPFFYPPHHCSTVNSESCL